MKKLLLSMAVASVLSTPGFASTLDIDINDTKQTIHSFGASDAWSINPTINKWQSEGNEQAIANLADMLFSTDKGIGLSAWRFNIGAGSAEQGAESFIRDPLRRAELLVPEQGGEIDPTKQRGQIRFMQEAHQRGVNNFIAFSNSPPYYLTKNGLAHPTAADGVGSTNLKPEHVDDFSDFLVDVLTYLRSDEVGVPVNYISPINEPTWEWEGQTQEGNRYNMKEVKAVYRSLDKKLTDAGLRADIHIDGGEVVEYTAALRDSYKRNFNGSSQTNGMNSRGVGLYRNYIDELLGDEEIRDIIGNQISLHGYFSDGWSDRLGKLRDMTYDNVKAVSPDAQIWMSEMSILGGAGGVRDFDGHGFDVNDMDYALHVGRIIHRDLTRLNASAWHWWLGLTPYDYKDGMVKIAPSLDADTVQDSKMMWTVGNYSRFIRPGYQRVELGGYDDLKGLMASAYLSPQGKELVVVMVNMGDTAEGVDLDIGNEAKISQLTTYVTNKEYDLEEVALAKKDAEYVVPPRSTVTFVATL
ncbi:putative xylanase [Photobacterium gaetbulicola Gung47]|uniref:Putative xylanase n=1 Tax=Photobacterium gaetbulicola Gung47 TaxID=658445 RepID=A0A0C5WE41_9GAMM|nr:glycoside hydrolase [Photobacterium gaetbulicola]AJR05338.1 putative xylanase [Photobacterium gaetbulicola Gung47]